LGRSARLLGQEIAQQAHVVILMRNLSIALGRRILPRLTEGDPLGNGIRTWLDTGSYYVEAGVRPDSIVLKNVSLPELLPYLSYDFERFAFSGLESLLFCLAELAKPKAIGWPLLKLYYSSFFGAHAVMRATGQAVTRIETRQAKRISDIAAVFGAGIEVGAGSYGVKIVQSADGPIDLTLARIGDSGGAHDQFWRQFYIYLTELGADVVKAAEPDAAAIVADISELQTLLVANGLSGGTWLSFVRNQINYQHDHGVWYPYGAPRATALSVARTKLTASSSIRLDYNPSKDPIGAFLASCRLISAVNVDLSGLLSKRPGAKRFARLWNRLTTEAA
jgi:hypothetical protein